MQLNSYVFIFIVLPISLVGYFGLNHIRKDLGKSFLVLMSFVFYLPSGIKGCSFFFGSILVNYVLTKLMNTPEERKSHWKIHSPKGYLVFGIILNVLLLFYCKYLNFFIDSINNIFKLGIVEANLILPLGISFYTFQQIAYLVDCYNGDLKDSEKGLLDYLLYISYFPKLLMGPITLPVSLISQFNDSEKKRFNIDNFIEGIQLFGIGLFKKVILADTFQNAMNWWYQGGQVSSIDILILMLSYTFLIYFDFSGYSDMAIGVSKMLNIELVVNFNSPYKAISIDDFWKRWHISLTKFFTKYLYIPLGGNRKGTIRMCINILIVFLVSGFWHGANWTFVLWGILHGVLSVLTRFIKPKKIVGKILGWICTFSFVNILWFLFQANSVKEWWENLIILVSFESMKVSNGLVEAFRIPEYNVVSKLLGMQSLRDIYYGIEILIAIGISFILCIFAKNSNQRKTMTILGAVFSAVIMLWGIMGLGQESVFIYNMF